MKILCDIYKGDKKEEMYLYVPKDGGPSKVPEELLTSFGELKLVTHHDSDPVAETCPGRHQ